MIHSSSTLPSYLCGAWTPPTQFRANMYRDSNCLQSLVFVRWTGWILAPTSGMVTFTISVGSNSPISETVKFYVDAREYIDTMSCHQSPNMQSYCQPQITNTAAISFSSGTYYAIDLEFLSYSQSPSLRLDWSHSGASSVIVPSSNLFSQRGKITSSNLPILNAIVCGTTSSLSGSGLSLAICGQYQSFSVTLRDIFSNSLKNSYSNSINVFCRIVAVSGFCINCPGVIPCNALLNRDSGLGLASYVVTKSGQYNLKVSIAPSFSSSSLFVIKSSPWSGYLTITSSGSYFFSSSFSNAHSVSITISGQVVSTSNTSVLLNVSVGSAVPIEIGFISTGTSSVQFAWKEPGKATFVALPSSSIFGPRNDFVATSLIIASSSNMPSPKFSTAASVSTFTAGIVSNVVLDVKDEFGNVITLNHFNDPVAFMSNSNPSTSTKEFVSYTASLSGSNHTFALSFTASGLYKISAKVVDSYSLNWNFFSNSYCSGNPLLSGSEKFIQYDWGSSAVLLNGMFSTAVSRVDGTSVEWSGFFLSRNSGAQTYIDCSGVGGIKIIVNGMIAVDRFIFSNSNTPNQPFSVRALMNTASSWNSLRIQFRDASGNASIACSGFGALGSSYFTAGIGTVSVSGTALTFSQAQSLPNGTSLYIFAQHTDAWLTSSINGFAQAMPIYQGTLSASCTGVSCSAAACIGGSCPSIIPITSQKFFYLLPNSTISNPDIALATSLVYGSLTSIPGFNEFDVVILPASPCASTSQLTLPSVTSVTTGAATNYAVRCKDKFSNFCTSCATSFLFIQGKPYLSLGTTSSISAGLLNNSITLIVPAPIDTPVLFAISTVALIEGSLACTYYSSSSFLNAPLVTGIQFPQVLSTINPAIGLPATFYGKYFSRWEGYLKATSTASYSIRASSRLAGNEKLRIWINDVIIIDFWSVVDAEMTGVFLGISDKYYLLKIEFEASHSMSSKLIIQYGTGSTFTSIPPANIFAAYHVVGSPFLMTATPIYGNVITTANGPGLSIATVGVMSGFTITLKDSILNSTFVSASLTSSLFWTTSNKRPWHDFPVKFLQTGTGIYQAIYNVTRSGTFYLEILCKTLRNTSTSPANSVCNAGVNIPAYNVIVNPGFAGFASFVTSTSNISVGVLQTFSISAKDSFGNNVSSGGYSFFRTTISNGEEVHSVPHIYVSANLHEVRYRVSASGMYTLRVQALLPGLSKLLVSDSLSSTSSSKTTVSHAILDFSDSATFKSTSSSELLHLMRYSGFIRPLTTGIHTFWIINPDTTKRHRTWLSDRYIVDSWEATSAAVEFSAVIGLASNAFYELFIDFANSGVSTSSTKTLTLQWQFSGNARSDISSTRLFQSYQNISVFTISAFPRSVCASACILSGIALSLATSGEASPFTIQMRDEFSNPTSAQQPTFIAQIISDATLRHSSKFQRNIHGILQKSSNHVITGVYVPIWKKTVPASYYGSSSLYQAFRNFNPYSGSRNDEAYWPMAYGGLYATAYAGPFEQVIISAAVPNGIHATYYSRLNNNGAIVRVPADTANAQAIVSAISASGGFNAGRFQGFFQPTIQGVYTFKITKPSSQSGRFWIDGVLLINDWTSPTATAVSGTLFLSLSPHVPMYSITLEYDTSSSPSISLQYACHQGSLQDIPSTSMFLRFDIPARVQGTLGSLSATYYNSNSIDATMAIASVFEGSYFAFSSNSGSSAPVLGTWTTAGTFSARWKGFIAPPKSDIFTFFLSKGHSSEFTKLYLDDIETINNPSGSTTLVMSQSYLFNHVPQNERFYSIVVEYGSTNSATTKKLAVSW